MTLKSIARWASILMVAVLFSCQGKTSQQASEGASQSSGVDAYTPSEEEQAQILENVNKGLLGDSTSFPYVYQGEGRSLIFQAYEMSFALTHQPALAPMMNQLVQWVKPEANNINNGIFITYVRNGRQLSLDQPYIQLQYINKSLPLCSTLDSVFYWMDTTFLANDNAKVLEKRRPIETASGLVAWEKSYMTGTNPQFPNSRSKWVSNAYIDYDENYLVAFGLSTMDQSDYELTKPLFEELIESLQFY